MTPAQLHLLRIECAARLLRANNPPDLMEVIDIPYSVAFNACLMVNSAIYDESKREEFSRHTAQGLIRIEKEINADPTASNKYFAD